MRQALSRLVSCWGSRLLGLVLCLATASIPALAEADEVDEAYARAGEAAAAGDWAGAIEHYEHARRILPQRSAQLSYDLGTAYANHGDLPRASYHLMRALDDPGGSSVEVERDARRNLAIVRRRLELAAAGRQAKLTEGPDWRDRLARALASTSFAWLVLAVGALAVGAVFARSLFRRRRGPLSAWLAWTAGIASLLLLAAHVGARRSDRAQAASIVLEATLDLREGPGAHTPSKLRLSGGSRVWVRERRSGWVRVQTPEALVGWAPESSLAALDEPVGAASPAAARDVGENPT